MLVVFFLKGDNSLHGAYSLKLIIEKGLTLKYHDQCPSDYITPIININRVKFRQEIQIIVFLCHIVFLKYYTSYVKNKNIRY